MGNKVGISVNNVSTTSLYAVGTLYNNGYTYGATRFTLSCNNTNFVDWSTSIPYGQNVSWSGWYNFGSSTSGRTFTVTAWWDSSGFGYVDNNSASQSVSIPAAAPSVTTPPAITNASLTLNTSTNVLTGSWTTNGSGTSTPNNIIVDVGIDDSWSQAYNSSVKNSHTFNGEDNHKYQFRMSSGNSAGRSSTVYTNIKYTKPATPTVKNATVTNTASGVTRLDFLVDISNVKWPNSQKIEWRYIYNNTAYGPNGSITDWFTSTTTGISVNSTDSSADATLISRLKECKNNAKYIAIQARVYNADNSIVSDTTENATAVNVTLPQVYLNIPEDSTLKSVYINMPDDWSPPQVRDDISLIQLYTTHRKDTYPNEMSVSSAGKIDGPWFVKNNAIGYTMQELSEFSIDGEISDDLRQNMANNPNKLTSITLLEASGRSGSSATISFVISGDIAYTQNITIPDESTFTLHMTAEVASQISDCFNKHTSSIMQIKITNVSSQADMTFCFPFACKNSQVYAGYLIA